MPMFSAKSKMAAAVFAVLGVAAVVVVVYASTGTRSVAVDRGNLKHGRMALRMDALHRVVGHHSAAQQLNHGRHRTSVEQGKDEECAARKGAKQGSEVWCLCNGRKTKVSQSRCTSGSSRSSACKWATDKCVPVNSTASQAQADERVETKANPETDAEAVKPKTELGASSGKDNVDSTLTKIGAASAPKGAAAKAKAEREAAEAAKTEAEEERKTKVLESSKLALQHAKNKLKNAANAIKTADAEDKEKREKTEAAAAATGLYSWGCKKRVRKDYRDLTKAEQQLYFKAIKTAKQTPIKNHTGTVGPGTNLYDAFVDIHAYIPNKNTAHSTSNFLPWHRKFLIEYESMLRSLGDEFRCVTLPYWDWAENSEACALDDSCKNYQKHDPLLRDTGGPGRSDGKFPAGALESHDTSHMGGNVGCMSDTSPFKDWVDSNKRCVGRGTDWDFTKDGDGKQQLGKDGNRGNYREMTPLVTHTQLMELIKHYPRYGTYGGFRAGLEGAPHNTQHNMLGGHLRSFGSPADPLFWSHHAMVDRIWALWQDCHDYDKDETAMKSKDNYEKGYHYKDVAIDGKMQFLHSTPPSSNPRSGSPPKNPEEVIPTWDTTQFSPIDYMASTRMHSAKGKNDEGRSVIYAPDELQKVFAERRIATGKEICKMDSHATSLIELGLGHLNTERNHKGTAVGNLLEMAGDDMQKCVSDSGNDLTKGIRKCVEAQCERDRKKAYGADGEVPVKGFLKGMWEWHSQLSWTEQKKMAPETLLPRCAIFAGADMEEKRAKMRARIDEISKDFERGSKLDAVSGGSPGDSAP